MFTKEAIDALTLAESITAARGSVQLAQPHGHGVVSLPSDFKITDLEPYLPRRRRARGTMTTNTLSAFAAYVRQHNNSGAVFVKAEDMSATAVLNMGGPTDPGHCDNLATLQLRKTAAYIALGQHTDSPKGQQAIAEFLEDWAGSATCFNDNVLIPDRQAIAAIRKLTIEAINKRESGVQSLSAERTEFESVTARSADTIPTLIYFDCRPYAELERRTFILRLSILTGGKDPMIVLRIVKAEEHREQMGAEFSGLVQQALDIEPPISVMLGSYSAK